MYSCRLSDCCGTEELADWQELLIGQTASIETSATAQRIDRPNCRETGIRVSEPSHAEGTVPAAGEGRSSDAIMYCRSNASLRMRVS